MPEAYCQITEPRIESYVDAHNQHNTILLDELAAETRQRTEVGQMLSGPTVARFLQLICTITQARRVLEIGTFTGYSALAMAEVLPADGQLHCVDNHPLGREIALKYFAKSGAGKKIQHHFGEALEVLPGLVDKAPFDMVFIDADKANYDNYYETTFPLLRSGGIIIFDNMLWYGRVLNVHASDDDTQAVIALNNKLTHDQRIRHVLLPVRDGIQLVQKK